MPERERRAAAGELHIRRRLAMCFQREPAGDADAVGARNGRVAIAEAFDPVIAAQETDIEIVGRKPWAEQRIGREERQDRGGFAPQHVAHRDARLAAAGDDGEVVDLERARRDGRLEHLRRVDEHVDSRGNFGLAEEARQWQRGEIGSEQEIGGDLQSREAHRARPGEAAGNRVAQRPALHRILLVELDRAVQPRDMRAGGPALREAVGRDRSQRGEKRAVQ